MQYADSARVKLKVILLGESGVGKTSLYQRFRSRHIPSTPKSALMLDQYQYCREFAVGPDSHPVQLELWDTANMERARSLTNAYYRETSATLLVYDVADAVSLRRVSYWQQELSHNLPDTGHRFFLVGNKTDLEPAAYDAEATTLAHAQEVMGRQCPDVLGVFEVSAKEDHGVEPMFHAVADHLWRQQGRTAQPAGASQAGSLGAATFRLEDGGKTKANGKGWGCC